MKEFPKIIVSLRCDYCRCSGVFRFESYQQFKEFNFQGWDLWKGDVLHGRCSKIRNGGNVSEQDVLAKGGKRKKEVRRMPRDQQGVVSEGEGGEG